MLVVLKFIYRAFLSALSQTAAQEAAQHRQLLFVAFQNKYVNMKRSLGASMLLKCVDCGCKYYTISFFVRST